MKNKLLIILGITLITFAGSVAFAQPGEGRQRNMKKVEQLEKAKLIDELGMNDELSIKFFNRRREFKEKQRSTIEQIDKVIDEIKILIESKSAEKDLAKVKYLNSERIKLESTMQKQRLDYLNSLSDLLSPLQISKYIVFEREFRKEIKEAVFRQRK